MTEPRRVGHPQPPVALYVHFPFCVSVCPYCDFVVYGGRAARGPENRIAPLVDALVAEIRQRGRRAPLASIYFGGGTPSLMSPGQLERLIGAADAAFGVRPGAEVTIEVNPGPADRGDLRGFRAVGANRVSIGAQSFVAHELKRLGRRHAPTDVASTVRLARTAGFDNVALDLLYDVPGQTLANWRLSVDAALALEPEHLSAYALTLDDGPERRPSADPTSDVLPPRAGALRWRRQARAAQDADTAAEMYELADDRFTAAGLRWYEISNWARAGMASVHNRAYWSGQAWEAVGPGAHAFDGVSRRWNAAQLDGYVSALAAGRLPPGASETARPSAARAELAILRLRTRDGLSASEATSRPLAETIGWARAAGLVEVAADARCRLTRRGRLLSNEVFVRLLGAPAAV